MTREIKKEDGFKMEQEEIIEKLKSFLLDKLGLNTQTAYLLLHRTAREIDEDDLESGFDDEDDDDLSDIENDSDDLEESTETEEEESKEDQENEEK